MKVLKSGGVETYDKHFGVGYQIGHEGYSPYKRVNRYREYYLNSEFYIDSQRALLVTEAYQENENAPQHLKMARVLEKILKNIKIAIDPNELVVGGICYHMRGAPVYPEFSYGWFIDELDNAPFDQREHDKYYITDEEAAKLRGIAAYWKGRTVQEAIRDQLTFDETKGSNIGKGLYLLNLYYNGGIGHVTADYEKLLQIGFGGYKDMVREKLEALDPTQPGAVERRIFYHALMIILDSVSHFILRYAQLADEMADAESDFERSQELERIADNCRQVAEGPARDIWEAVQLYHFATTVMLLESNGHSVSYGRMDQYLYSYYREDIDTGRFSQEFIQELLEMLLIKMGTPSKARDYPTVLANSGRGWGGESLVVGGVGRDGQDVTNDLTFMILDASAHTRLRVPWLCVRLHANTPYELRVKTAEVIRAGFGHPKVFNDETAIPAALAKGRTLEEARDYSVVGCVEIDTPGLEYGWHDAAYMNIAKVFELAINDGRCVACGEGCKRYNICAGIGKRLGPQTGSIAEFQTIEEVMESFDKQMKYWCDQMTAGCEVMDITHRRLKPTPYLSIFFDDCIEKGLDLSEGGARYNHTGPQANGIGTVADGLSALSQLVFDEKKTTGQELLDAVNHNWEGYEALYALVNSSKVHHYGNDDDYADRFAQFAFDTYCSHIEGRGNVRGGTYTPGVYTVSANVSLGLLQPASIEGRKANEPISDNMGPVHTAASSHDICGPTAIANSVTKMNHSRATNGTLLNWKIPPECISGQSGRENLISLIDTYFMQKGMHSQFNIVSSKTLRDAQKHPEKYRDMLVRVAGYSAYFVDLSKPLQEDIIGRTELSFE